MGALQQHNTEMVALLTSEFQRRYEPNFAWKSAVSSLMGLPALRACWPMSVVDYTNPQATDTSGNGYDLTNNNSADFAYDQMAPYVQFDGSTQYLSRADGGAGNWADIIGTEAYVETAQRGLSLGGWFQTHSTPGASGVGLISKYLVAGNQISYALLLLSSYRVWVGVSSTGAANTTTAISSLAGATTDDTWFFAAGVFEPSTLLTAYLNDTVGRTISGDAAIFDSTTALEIGRYNATNYLDGRASLCWLCACALPAAVVGQLFQQQRGLFGV